MVTMKMILISTITMILFSLTTVTMTDNKENDISNIDIDRSMMLTSIIVVTVTMIDDSENDIGNDIDNNNEVDFDNDSDSYR